MTTNQKPKTAAQLLFEKSEFATFLGASDAAETDKNSVNFIYGDGRYLRRKNALGTFFRKVDDFNVPGLEAGPAPSFQLSLPKIPKSILKTQVSFYRNVMKHHNNAESYTIIFWDTLESKYVVDCPKQKISPGSVVYILDEAYATDRYIQVVSCHSHNSMGAFFSSTDDRDERGDMCYMVMGELNKTTPAYKIRACLQGAQACFLEIEDLFDCTKAEFEVESSDWTSAENYPVTWMAQLNVDANFDAVRQHRGRGEAFHQMSQGTQMSFFDNFRRTSKSFFDSADYQELSNSARFEQEEVAVLQGIAVNFVRSLDVVAVPQAINKLIQSLVKEDYAEDVYDALAEYWQTDDNPIFDQSLFADEDSFTSPDPEDAELGDLVNSFGDSEVSFTYVNEYIKTMNEKKD